MKKIRTFLVLLFCVGLWISATSFTVFPKHVNSKHKAVRKHIVKPPNPPSHHILGAGKFKAHHKK